MNGKSVEISILYDNKCAESGFITSFGFSVLIYNYSTRNYLLFDTGSNGKTLIHNINKFKITCSSITKIIISHNHHDHAGGLLEIYSLNKRVELYVPYNDLNSYRDAFPELDIRGILEMAEIEENIYSSGQLLRSSISEQGLVLKLKNQELILLVGCAHPGLKKFILKARELGSIMGIIGGFHGFKDLEYMEGTKFIGACHCTQHIDSIKKKFPQAFHRVCVGKTFLF